VLRKAPAKKTTHRALDDVRESVAELAYYRRTIFAPDPARAPEDQEAAPAGAAAREDAAS